MHLNRSISIVDRRRPSLAKYPFLQRGKFLETNELQFHLTTPLEIYYILPVSLLLVLLPISYLTNLLFGSIFLMRIYRGHNVI